VNLDTDGFTETGGAAALNVLGDETTVTFTTLGLRASHQFSLDNGFSMTARGMLGWRHAFGDVTDRFVRGATAERQTDYFDALTKELSLRVSPGGGKAWFLRYTKPGERKRARLKIGTFPELSLAAARAAARDTRRAIAEGADPQAEKAAAKAAMTVRDLVETYVTRHASDLRSGDEVARRLRRNLSAEIGATAHYTARFAERPGCAF
jgi:hypothetical protein